MGLLKLGLGWKNNFNTAKSLVPHILNKGASR